MEQLEKRLAELEADIQHINGRLWATRNIVQILAIQLPGTERALAAARERMVNSPADAERSAGIEAMDEVIGFIRDFHDQAAKKGD